MLNKRLIKWFYLILLLTIIPTYTQNAKAILILEEPNYPEIGDNWMNVSLLYENHYHNTSTLWEELNHFNSLAPEIFDLSVIGQSYFNKDIKLVRITNELRTNQKAKTMVVANHHGREQISVEVALQFILYLITGYGIDPLITESIDSQEIYIIPTLNPDALDMVINDNNHWLRKNARPYDDDNDGFFDEDPPDDINADNKISGFFVYEKVNETLVYLYGYREGFDNDGDGLINEDMIGHVDLNRNYDMFFREGTSWDEDSLSDSYPGLTAFSEPETQVFRDFALEHRFAMAYSLHSGTNATYFAKNSLNYLEPEICEAMMIDFSNMMPDSYYFNNYFPGVPGDDPYYASGIWDNWMYFERETLMPISLELYGNLTATTSEFENPIIDNTTHLITEWKDIENFYNPEAYNINTFWDDVQPAFAYLLENTPRLATQATLHSIVDRPGSLVNMTFTCSNLSPKIRSILPIDIFDTTGTKRFDGLEVLADSTIVIDTTFNLPFSFNDTYEIMIGNEYTGFQHYILRTYNTSTSGISFSIIGIAIVTLSLIIHLIHRKK
ncbi:MAG: hypothetical protein FK734_05330 [Asgard group archaeon]|nr:hypothetical protein [Asgard group archaeon]